MDSDANSQKEKLEQELRFLKESYETEVISKEEFEKGKERIEKKLDFLSGSDENTNEEKEEKQSNEEYAKTNEKIESDKLEANDAIKEPEKEAKKDKSNLRYIKYAVVFALIVFAVIFAFNSLKNGKSPAAAQKFECYSNSDCIKDLQQGACINQATEQSKCVYQGIKHIKVLVIIDKKECFNCGTSRVLNILYDWFGPLNVTEITYDSLQGAKHVEEYDLNVLPAYIITDNSIKDNKEFDNLKSLFVEKDGDYLLKDDAAGSTFYFKRQNIPNKLDFFVKDDAASMRAETNLLQFLESFSDIDFIKHGSNDTLAKELNVRTFPTFLVNNRIKFSGVLPPNTIKENFCSVNKHQNCDKELSRSLV